MLSNLEITADGEGRFEAAANFLIVEHRLSTRFWAGRAQWWVSEDSGEWRLHRKVVELVDRQSFLPTIGFLL